ncbi:hypothetical protein MRX96_036072 [Rhipicephalus microplus]
MSRLSVHNLVLRCFTHRAQSIRVHTFFMAQYAINVFVNNTMTQIEEEIPWKKESPFEYFLNVSAFMAKDWASPIRHPLIEQRKCQDLKKVEHCTAVIVAYKSMCERPDLKKAGMTTALQDRYVLGYFLPYSAKLPCEASVEDLTL